MDLTRLSTFGIGGEVAQFQRVREWDDLEEIVGARRAGSAEQPFIIGEASNILFADEPFQRPVLKIKHEFIRRDGDLILVGAGTDLHAFILTLIQHGIGGLTSLSGVPGSVGGGVRGNAGAYGTEIGSRVAYVDVIDLSSPSNASSPRRHRLSPSEVGFRYRGSGLVEQPHILIWEVAFDLPERATPATLLAERAKVIEQRRAKLPWAKSAGSFFKNLALTQLSDDQQRAIEALGVTPTHDKIAIGALNEKLGLKGARVGGAGISPMHGNYVINRDHATAADVRALVWHVWKRVHDATGVSLGPEVQVLDPRGQIIPIAAMEADAASRPLALG